MQITSLEHWEFKSIIKQPDFELPSILQENPKQVLNEFESKISFIRESI